MNGGGNSNDKNSNGTNHGCIENNNGTAENINEDVPDHYMGNHTGGEKSRASGLILERRDVRNGVKCEIEMQKGIRSALYL